MANYQFAPNPDISDGLWAYWEKGFTEQELDWLVAYGDALDKVKGTIGATTSQLSENLEIRDSQVSWIQMNNDTTWLFDRIAWISRMLNTKYFNYDLYGFMEDFQYTTYYGSKNQHYDWHMDRSSTHQSGQVPRKLSLVMQLSDPKDYKGGDLEFKEGTLEIKAKRERGIIYVFPAWLLHRVTPVTEGTRRSLVIWTSGPAFR